MFPWICWWDSDFVKYLVINIHYSQIPLVSLSIVVESPSLLLTSAYFQNSAGDRQFSWYGFISKWATGKFHALINFPMKLRYIIGIYIYIYIPLFRTNTHTSYFCFLYIYISHQYSLINNTLSTSPILITAGLLVIKLYMYMVVFWNRGTPKSSSLIGFPYYIYILYSIYIYIMIHPFWETSMCWPSNMRPSCWHHVPKVVSGLPFLADQVLSGGRFVVWSKWGFLWKNLMNIL